MGIFNSNYDLNKYKILYAVAEYNSFSRAAESLHLSQPAISYAIKELEEQLGTQLLIRNNKNVQLTDDGKKIIFYIKNAFDNIVLGERLLKEKGDDLNGHVKIGIHSNIAKIILPKTIKKFRELYPNIQFYIYTSSSDELIAKLNNKELDLIIIQYPIFLREVKMTEEIICECETCFFGSKEYYDLYNQEHNFSNIPIILPKDGYPDIMELEETIKKQNVHLNHCITCYTNELTIEFVKQNIGIGWGLKDLIKNELETNVLYEIEVPYQMPKTKFSIAYDCNFINKSTQKFIAFLKENI